jgi:RNA recognition motif-containing protein
MNIYVGSLSFDASENDLREAFEAHGTVESVSIINDKFTGRSRGFGFVTMPDDAQARTAIASVNGKSIAGRAVTVNEARPKTEGGPRGGGGGRDRGPRRDSRGDSRGGGRAPRW